MTIKDKIINFFFEEVKEKKAKQNFEEVEDAEVKSESTESVKQESQKTETLPSCCKPREGKKPSGFLQGLVWGIVPHIGCIAFILASILGLTAAASFFRPLVAKSYFFYIMIAMSLVFATISALFYLRKNGGVKEAKHHKKYLTIMYGSTILVSVLLYFVIFPLVAGSTTGYIIADLQNLNTITLDVAIPCPGHAPLITDELKKLDGVIKVEYSPIKTFKVYYDPVKITKEKILELEVFKEYKATITDESSGVSTTNINIASNSGSSSSGSCCGSGSCGGSSGCSCDYGG